MDKTTIGNRIGQYTFTYQDKKLKKLTSYGWNMGVSGDDLILKINELIDAVNELRDKNDRQAK